MRPTPTEDEALEETPVTVYEKYAAVYEQNPDFAGWITIPGTNIDYPVMQSIDNPNFYLKHAFDGSYSNYGVPYAQENCDLKLSDNIILYGYHMNDGSMFADLCKYESEDFYREHSTFTLVRTTQATAKAAQKSAQAALNLFHDTYMVALVRPADRRSLCCPNRRR